MDDRHPVAIAVAPDEDEVVVIRAGVGDDEGRAPLFNPAGGQGEGHLVDRDGDRAGRGVLDEEFAWVGVRRRSRVTARTEKRERERDARRKEPQTGEEPLHDHSLPGAGPRQGAGAPLSGATNRDAAKG